jgi:hypothetical protein
MTVSLPLSVFLRVVGRVLSDAMVSVTVKRTVY